MDPDQLIQAAEPTIEEKEKEIQEQKKQFLAVVKIFVTVIIGTLIITILGIIIKKITTPTNPPVVINPDPTENPPIIVNPIEDAKTKLYNSPDLKLSFEYPENARIEEDLESDLTKKVEVIYEKDGKEGYIFRISTFTTEARDLEAVAEIKRQSFISRCPETAGISQTIDIYIDTVDAKEFSVTNCDANYEISYAPKFYQYYEFARVYKGDYGYWQQYKKVTAGILDSIKFYPDEIDPKPILPYDIFESTKYEFIFHHPKLSEDCCNITGPRSATAINSASFYQPDTFKNNSEYNGIGVFVDPQEGKGVKKLGFEEYMVAEKQRLKDDYVIIRGRNPETSETELNLGKFEAIRLSGYTWEGNDLIYTEITNNSNKTLIVIFAVKNITGDDFEESTVNLITKSFALLEKDQ